MLPNSAASDRAESKSRRRTGCHKTFWTRLERAPSALPILRARSMAPQRPSELHPDASIPLVSLA